MLVSQAPECVLSVIVMPTTTSGKHKVQAGVRGAGAGGCDTASKPVCLRHYWRGILSQLQCGSIPAATPNTPGPPHCSSTSPSPPPARAFEAGPSATRLSATCPPATRPPACPGLPQVRVTGVIIAEATDGNTLSDSTSMGVREAMAMIGDREASVN